MARAKSAKKEHMKVGTSKAASKQRREMFAHHYLQNGGNARQAATAAGYAPGHASDIAGDRCLRDPAVKAIISAVLEKAKKKAGLTSEEVVLSMARAVRFDPRKLYAQACTEDGKPMFDDHKMPIMRMLEPWELDDDTALVIQSVEIKKNGAKKIVACDRNTARDQAHKFFGHYDKDNAQKQPQVVIVATRLDENL